MLDEAIQQLSALRLGPMAQRLKAWTDDPSNLDKSHAECVVALAIAQQQAMTNTRLRRVFARADLPNSGALCDFRNSGQRGVSASMLGNLRTCDWIRRGHCLVITGGSHSGKTYLASALTREATMASLSAIYWRVPEWLNAYAIETNRGPAELARFLKQQAKADLFVLDDFAMERVDRKQCYALRRLLDARARHERALLVASPNAIGDWQGYFKDAASADAIFARVLSRHNHIELKASSTVVG